MSSLIKAGDGNFCARGNHQRAICYLILGDVIMTHDLNHFNEEYVSAVDL